MSLENKSLSMSAQRATAQSRAISDFEINQNFITSNFGSDFSYMGDSIGGCGGITVGLSTAFQLLKKNTIIEAVIKRVSGRIGYYGFDLLDEHGVVIDNAETKEIKSRARKFFSAPSFRQYRTRAFTMALGSGKVYQVPTTIDVFGFAGEEATSFVIDSRGVIINEDSAGFPASYTVLFGNQSQSYSLEQMVDQMVYQDINRPLYGSPAFESAIIDGLTDISTAKRQLLFFYHDATPGAIYMLKKDASGSPDAIESLKKQIRRKHGGTGNSHKPIVSNIVDDVKVLDISTKDLELIKGRLFSDKKMGVTLGFDLRLLNYMRDSGGSFSEIDSMTTKQANTQLDEYAAIIEEGMITAYNKFIKPIPYTFKLLTNYYIDIHKEKKLALEELNAGAITANEYRDQFDRDISTEEGMDEFMVNNSRIPLRTAVAEPVAVDSTE